MNNRNLILLGMIFLAIVSRFIITAGPNWANFSPIGAMALFSGYYFRNKPFGMLMTFLGIWLSNMIINNLLYTEYFDGFSYGLNLSHILIFLAITAYGQLNQGGKGEKLAMGDFLRMNLFTAFSFFMVSNFLVWLGSEVTYTKDLGGLLACYTAGLPFIQNTILSQLFFGAIFFGAYQLIESKYFVAKKV
ncbi:MAG: hypothetical protein RIR51_387 [Bacteroidota bacterium]|jgi:hypothetical protein